MCAGTAKYANPADAGRYEDSLFAVSLCASSYRRSQHLQATIENRRMKIIVIEVVISLSRNSKLTPDVLTIQPQLSNALEKRTILNRILAKPSIVVGSRYFLGASKLDFSDELILHDRPE